MYPKRKINFILFNFVLICTFASCEFSDLGPADVPAYLYIPKINTEVNANGTQGDSTQQFQDIWVYAGNDFIGTFGLPAMIPIPKTGNTTLDFEAGITNSGIDGDRIMYPMMQTYSTQRNLEVTKIDTITPTFKYSDFAKFPFIEDFDGVGLRFSFNPLYSTAGDTILRINNDEALVKGRNSGKLQISKSATAFQMYTTELFKLPGFNQPVFWEMSYKSNQTLVFGYYYFEPNQPSSQPTEVIRLFPTNGKWNKVYISLNLELVNKKPNTEFRFFLGLFKGANTDADVYLDNLKLVYLD